MLNVAFFLGRPGLPGFEFRPGLAMNAGFPSGRVLLRCVMRYSPSTQALQHLSALPLMGQVSVSMGSVPGFPKTTVRRPLPSFIDRELDIDPGMCYAESL